MSERDKTDETRALSVRDERAVPIRGEPPAPPPVKRAKRRWLFLPFGIAALLVVAYVAAWFHVKGLALQTLDRWVAERKAEGQDAGYDAARTLGFPLRFALEIDGLRTADPLRGTSWSAAKLRFHALPYDYKHIIAESRGPITMTFSDRRRWVLTQDKAMASLRWDDQGLERLSVDMQGLAWTAGDGAQGALKAYALQAVPSADGAGAIKFESEAVQGRVPAVPADLSAFGRDFASIKTEGEITHGSVFMQGFSRPAMDQWAAQNGVVRFNTFDALWGPGKFEGKGFLGLDSARRPAGQIDFMAKDVEALAQSLVVQGWIKGPAADLFMKGAREAQAKAGGLQLQLLAKDGALMLWGLPISELRPLYAPPLPPMTLSPGPAPKTVGDPSAAPATGAGEAPASN